VRWDDCTGKAALGADRHRGLSIRFLDGHKLVEQAIKPFVLAAENCLVLLDPNYRKTLQELLHRRTLEFTPLHGLRLRIGSVLPARSSLILNWE
jgi:hypothetical protein